RVFVAYLSVLMVPAVVLLIPRFLIINALGWVDSYTGLISTELVSVWGIFLLRQCFLTIPRDLEDAARLDGAGEWTVFWRVVLPLSKPALATLAVIAFADQWKSFLWPLIATRSAGPSPPAAPSRTACPRWGLFTVHGTSALHVPGLNPLGTDTVTTYARLSRFTDRALSVRAVTSHVSSAMSTAPCTMCRVVPT